ncbi:MAG: efflux transporter outer membrane subunit [Planctomycetes bacterium]|nr:efflux transporter outer membrane subunit [Planctomycetota bacterium]
MKRLLFLLPPLLFVACASPPPPRQPEVGVEVPAHWTETRLGEGEVADDWWKAFGDTALDALIDEALRNNPSLREAASRIAAAGATVRGVQSGAMPNINAGIDTGRNRSTINLPGAGLQEIESQRIGVSLNLSWEIDLWGRVRAQQSAAIADRQAIEASYYGARLSLIAQVAKAYFSASEAWQQLGVARDNLSATQQLLERVHDRFKAGLRPALDYRLALADEAVTRARVETRERVYKLARRQLEVLLGRYPAAQVETGASLGDDLPPVPGGLPAQLLTRRPDIVEAERRVAAADSRVRAAYLDLLPRISLTGSTGLASDQVSDVLDGKFFVWNLLGNLLAPLFDGGRRLAEISRTEALEEGALAYYALVALSAFADVENSLANEHHLRRELTALDVSVRESESALNITRDRYFQGLLDITRVMETQRQYYSAQSARLATRAALLAARIDLYAALGGGFDAEMLQDYGVKYENP